MAAKKKRLTVELDSEVQQRLKDTAARKGVSMGQYCRAAIESELAKDDAEGSPPVNQMSIVDLIALRKEIFGDRVLNTDSAEIIREMREERTRHLESLAWPDSS